MRLKRCLLRFCEQSNEHDDACLHVDVVLDAEHTCEQEAAGQSERYGENDGERDQ